MLLQGLNQHLLEGRDLLQISLNVTDVGNAESAQRGKGEEETFRLNPRMSCMYSSNMRAVPNIIQYARDMRHLSALQGMCVLIFGEIKQMILQHSCWSKIRLC